MIDLSSCSSAGRSTIVKFCALLGSGNLLLGGRMEGWGVRLGLNHGSATNCVTVGKLLNLPPFLHL